MGFAKYAEDISDRYSESSPIGSIFPDHSHVHHQYAKCPYCDARPKKLAKHIRNAHGPAAVRSAAIAVVEPVGIEVLPHVKSLSAAIAVVEPVGIEVLLHVKSLIVRLEEYLIWEALEEDWLDRRGQWVEEVSFAKQIVTLGPLVGELEAHLLWVYCEAGWVGRRPLWLSMCENTSGIAELVETLIDLEDHITFGAFQPGWSNDRIHWGSMVQSLYPA